ncbi:hypothetical protein [Streptomonospora salina]|uniref:Uncharacterized protein n=1 Tax=Streptomonospora salina TaxID=104205 RepID=A0A841EE83_9ACTN|nr:hypothetical protein [Streptomonospora salina]MBB6000684.1 hypothetical protein [Streptomonospora salina]
MRTEDGAGTALRRRPGLLPWWCVLGLAALGLPRVVAHDLGLVGPAANTALVFGPVLVWVAVAVLGRLRRPLVALLIVGAVYGVLLAAVHQVLWAQGFAGDPPQLGGELAGTLPPASEGALLRAAAVVSSVATGVGIGAVSGAVAWVLARLLPRRPA